MASLDDFYYTDETGKLQLAIDPEQAAKVKDPMPIMTTCHYCGGKVDFTSNDVLYSGRLFGDWPFAYVCRGCRAYVGVHPQTLIPLGMLADKDTREARVLAKNVFKEAQERNKLTRNQAYALLAQHMNIPASKCHYAMFNTDMCLRASALINLDRIFDPVTAMGEKLKALLRK